MGCLLHVRGLLALELEPLIAAKAKEKMDSTLRQNTGLPTLAEREPPIDTREEVAKVAGVSTGTMHKVKKVRDTGTRDWDGRKGFVNIDRTDRHQKGGCQGCRCT